MSYAGLAHFGDYNPPDFGWAHQVPDLVPLVVNGVNFGQCARDAHPVFLALLADLVPHIPGGLSAGSCWAYSTTDDLPNGAWSFHRYGIAIDVNWNVNKMGTPSPASGQHAIPAALASTIAHSYGCEYGGDWPDVRDWMHFEIHLPPSIARTVTGGKDWFDMATIGDLETAVRAVLRYELPRIAGVLRFGTGNAAYGSANTGAALIDGRGIRGDVLAAVSGQAAAAIDTAALAQQIVGELGPTLAAQVVTHLSSALAKGAQ